MSSLSSTPLHGADLHRAPIINAPGATDYSLVSVAPAAGSRGRRIRRVLATSVSALRQSIAGGTALTNSVASTTLLTGATFPFAGGSKNLPPLASLKLGSIIEITAHGIISSAAATPGTLTLQPKIAGAVQGSVVSPTLPINLAAQGWELFVRMYLKAAPGAAGSVDYYTVFTYPSAAGSSAANAIQAFATANTDLSAAAGALFDLFAQFSVASASNIITPKDLTIVQVA